ncbi:MAG: hypothetical protein M3Q07_00840 [Pseudobdellovibrionaceae bacterium]|nr:hypothetical protein [Pseudobdellovibrionaceae bacterium]
MSEYKRKSTDGTYNVRFGWDGPLETFFATAEEAKEPGDEWDEIDDEWDDPDDDPFWIGQRRREIEDPRVLAELISSYLVLSPDEIERLQQDKDEYLPAERNPELVMFSRVLEGLGGGGMP